MKRNVDQGRGVAAPSFRLDAVNQCAWLGTGRISLSPKAFSVLFYLAERPGRLVTKQELLDAIWPDVHVTEGVLKRAILEIRKALDDSTEDPRFIQTLHRRGYRFLLSTNDRPHLPAVAGDRPTITGREMERFQLDAWFETASRETRQLVFVTGELGLGKSALLDCWTESLRKRLSRTPGAVAIAYGRCIRQFGPVESFFPVFGVLHDLARQLGRRLADVMRVSAPTWLQQMPALVSANDPIRSHNEDVHSNGQRTLRELVDALEALSQEVPLVIVLEDLQWADPSTIDLLSAIARRTSRARLLVIGTYRPAEAARMAPALLAVQAELEIHDQCEVLPLDRLSASEANEYLATLSEERVSATAAEAICRRANGNPLFLSAIAEHSRRSGGAGVEETVPETLQQIFEQNLTELTEREQMVVRAAAAAGETFSIACLAEVLGWDEAETEILCDTLVRRHRILEAVDAEGNQPAQHRFRHGLFRDAAYRTVPAGMRNQVRTAIARAEKRGTVVGPVLVVPAKSATLGDVFHAVRPFRALAGEAAA